MDCMILRCTVDIGLFLISLASLKTESGSQCAQTRLRHITVCPEFIGGFRPCLVLLNCILSVSIHTTSFSLILTGRDSSLFRVLMPNSILAYHAPPTNATNIPNAFTQPTCNPKTHTPRIIERHCFTLAATVMVKGLVFLLAAKET